MALQTVLFLSFIFPLIQSLGKSFCGRFALQYYSDTDEPVIQPFLFPKNTKIGQRTSVTCLVTEGSEPLHFSWLKNGKVIQDPDIQVVKTKSSSLLSFHPIKSQDGGEYCIVKNPVGTASQSAVLLIELEY